MTRARRMCPTLPTWMLRMILALPSWRDWWAEAYLEIWKREVEDILAAAANSESGPWACVAPRGMH